VFHFRDVIRSTTSFAILLSLLVDVGMSTRTDFLEVCFRVCLQGF
jgi:hypothetical protein